MDAVGQQACDPAWDSGPLPAELVLGATPVLKEPRLVGGRLFWLEQLPAQRGRTTLRLRHRLNAQLELTPDLDLRSRIHGYGGGSYCLAGDTVVVVAEAGRSLWRLDLPGDADDTAPPAPLRLTPAPDPQQDGEPALYGDGLIDLTRQRWIGVCEQAGRDRLVAVPLSGGGPRLLWESPDFCGYAVLSPSGSHLAWVSWRQPCMPWDRSELWLGRLDASGDLLDARPVAGSAPGDERPISVFQPLWAGPDLVVANDRSGWWNLELLENAEALVPAAPPAWRPLLPMPAEFGMPQWVYGMRTTAWDGSRLVAACCRDGRWQLGVLLPEDGTPAETEGCIAPSGPPSEGTSAQAAPRLSEAAACSPDLGPPADPQQSQWAAGGTSGLTAGGGLTSVDEPAAQRDTSGSLAPQGSALTGAVPAARREDRPLRGPLRWQPIPLPFDDLAFVEAEAGRLVAIASGPLDGPGLLELDLPDPAGMMPGDTGQAEVSMPPPARWTHRLAAPALLAPGRISRPEPLWFAGHAGRPTHAWYYPPRGGASASSPLLVRGHSGPTAMARTGLSLAIQFWTSRGWGVLDVNYGGSTGFGRAYRTRLDGGWGVVDVDDCLAAARAVVESGRADAGRIAMEGSSASGFTVLAAMARGTTVRAGAVRYPVTDLGALAEADHRFEARYFDALVGPWPEARALYEQRSPLQQVDRIHAALLFFHGLEDPVVPAQQSIAMVERLRQRGVPVELELFEGEGHGFRDGAVQRQVLERSEAFFRERFGLDQAG